jgi:NRPS condensation-like uncharacterized protein
MKVSLPFSRTKRYLTGMDWVIGALNDMTGRITGGTNASQVVLELEGPFDAGRFRAAITDFGSKFPVLGGIIARDWNFAPYWKMPRAGCAVPVAVEVETVAEADILPALARSANARFPGRRDHVVFRVFDTGGPRHFVIMQFDHCLFDAHGAEAFLELFHRVYRGEDCSVRIAGISLTEPAHLCDWMRKFEAGKLLVRMLRSFADAALVIFRRPLKMKGREFKFALLKFDEHETQAITDRAYREAGFLMFMPYALTAAVQALDAVRRRNGIAGNDYLVSVSVDLRTPDTAAAKVFFNHVSFLFFRVPVAAAEDRQKVLEAVRAQMYEQIKSSFPQAMAESSMVMRILPMSMLGRLMLKPMRGEFSSFGFTCIGKGGYACPEFMEARVANLFHMPLVPVPPGLGLVVNHSGNRMNVVLSYLDGMFSDEDIRNIKDDLRRGL